MKNLLKTLVTILTLTILVACYVPSWLTYTNTTYLFQFNYPPDSSIVTDSPYSARIQLPITAGTNLVEKYLDVSVDPGAIPCLSPYGSSYSPPGSLMTGTQTINGIYWVIEEASEGAMGSIYQWTAYSTSNGEACVSLTFVLHSHNPGVYPTPPPEFDQASESIVFPAIVTTFTWLTSLPTLVDTSTPTPLVTHTPPPVITLTSTALSYYFVPKFNSNCRNGPDMIFNSIALAMKGQSYLIDGRNKENTWLYIMINPNLGCWVPIENGTPSADTTPVRVLADIPTPTFTPAVNCGQYPDEKTCSLYRDICVWVIPPTGGRGTCQNR